MKYIFNMIYFTSLIIEAEVYYNGNTNMAGKT